RGRCGSGRPDPAVHVVAGTWRPQETSTRQTRKSRDGWAHAAAPGRTVDGHRLLGPGRGNDGVGHLLGVVHALPRHHGDVRQRTARMGTATAVSAGAGTPDPVAGPARRR